VRLPADLAHWNARFADAYEAFLEADLAFDKMESRLAVEHREELLAMGSKATEAAVREAVQTDPRWSQARMARIDAEVDKVRARGVVDAILAKKDMLISLGAHVRQEIDNNPTLREQVRGRALVEGR